MLRGRDLVSVHERVADGGVPVDMQAADVGTHPHQDGLAVAASDRHPLPAVDRGRRCQPATESPGGWPRPASPTWPGLALKRCYEGLQSARPAVSVRDAVVLVRLAHEIEHDAALAERDAARRQMEEWRQEFKSGLWAVRSVLVGQYGQDARAAFSAEVKKLRAAAPR